MTNEIPTPSSVGDTQSPQTPTPQKKNFISSLKTSPWIWVVVIVLLAFGAWFFSRGDGAGLSGSVAIVNGTEISRERYEQAQVQLARSFSGSDIDIDTALIEQQALDSLVNETLFLGAAAVANIVIDDTEIDTRFQEEKNQFNSEKEFQDTLRQYAINEEELRENIKRQMIIEAFIQQEIGDPGAVTEEEIVSAYNNAVAQLGDGLPPLADVREEVRQQISEGKQQQKILSLIELLRADARITTSL